MLRNAFFFFAVQRMVPTLVSIDFCLGELILLTGNGGYCKLLVNDRLEMLGIMQTVRWPLGHLARKRGL